MTFEEFEKEVKVQKEKIIAEVCYPNRTADVRLAIENAIRVGFMIGVKHEEGSK